MGTNELRQMLLIGDTDAVKNATNALDRSDVQIIGVTMRMPEIPPGCETVAPDKKSIIKTDENDDPKLVADKITDLMKKGKEMMYWVRFFC